VFVLRGLVAFLLVLAGLWVGYAAAAGYVGVLPVPVNFVAGLASVVILGAAAMRVAVRP
jgi:hypothetical protein